MFAGECRRIQIETVKLENCRAVARTISGREMAHRMFRGAEGVIQVACNVGQGTLNCRRLWS